MRGARSSPSGKRRGPARWPVCTAGPRQSPGAIRRSRRRRGQGAPAACRRVRRSAAARGLHRGRSAAVSRHRRAGRLRHTDRARRLADPERHRGRHRREARRTSVERFGAVLWARVLPHPGWARSSRSRARRRGDRDGAALGGGPAAARAVRDQDDGSPQYHRVLTARSHVWSPRASLRAPRAVTDGNGFVFVDHVGNICPAGNVRQDEHPLFLALRDPARLGGRCGRCEWRDRCGGSRPRACAASGDPLAEDPGCAYQPAHGWPEILRPMTWVMRTTGARALRSRHRTGSHTRSALAAVGLGFFST